MLYFSFSFVANPVQVDGLIEYTPNLVNTASTSTSNNTYVPELKSSPFIATGKPFTGIKGNATVTLKCI